MASDRVLLGTSTPPKCSFTPVACANCSMQRCDRASGSKNAAARMMNVFSSVSVVLPCSGGRSLKCSRRVCTCLAMLGIVMVFSLISGRRALATVHCVSEPRPRRKRNIVLFCFPDSIGEIARGELARGELARGELAESAESAESPESAESAEFVKQDESVGG